MNLSAIMRKNSLLFIFLLLFAFCGCASLSRSYSILPCKCSDYDEHPEYFRVGYFIIRKIDFYKNMYIIYAQRGDSIYKIHSPREHKLPTNGKYLNVGDTCYLYLYPLLNDALFNKAHFIIDLKGYGFKLKNIHCKYCVKNVFGAANILSNYVYKECFTVEYYKKDRVRRLKRFKEPDIELPTEWDYLPNYK